MSVSVYCTSDVEPDRFSLLRNSAVKVAQFWEISLIPAYAHSVTELQLHVAISVNQSSNAHLLSMQISAGERFSAE